MALLTMLWSLTTTDDDVSAADLSEYVGTKFTPRLELSKMRGKKRTRNRLIAVCVIEKTNS